MSDWNQTIQKHLGKLIHKAPEKSAQDTITALRAALEPFATVNLPEITQHSEDDIFVVRVGDCRAARKAYEDSK
jgi:hypothetical protein